jgi:hypothetical protein
VIESQHAALEARLAEGPDHTYILSVNNVGDVPVERVQWSLPTGVANWNVSVANISAYPIPVLGPGEEQTAPVIITLGGPTMVEITLRGWVEAVEYTWQRTLSVAGATASSPHSVPPAADVEPAAQQSDKSTTGSARGSLTDWIIRLGQVAGALVVIAGVITGGWYWLFPAKDAESADVSIERVSPRTYGGWLSDENISRAGFSQEELETPGIKVTYALSTEGFERGTELPVSVLLSDLAGKTIAVRRDPFTLDRKRDGCDGCNDWLRIDPNGGTVWVAIEVFRPGADEDPISSDGKRYCPRSGTIDACD